MLTDSRTKFLWFFALRFVLICPLCPTFRFILLFKSLIVISTTYWFHCSFSFSVIIIAERFDYNWLKSIQSSSYHKTHTRRHWKLTRFIPSAPLFQTCPFSWTTTYARPVQFLSSSSDIMERDTNQMSQSAPLCRSGCGYYGHPSSDGLCSKCYKDALKRKQAAPTTASSSSSISVDNSSNIKTLIAASSAITVSAITAQDSNPPSAEVCVW